MKRARSLDEIAGVVVFMAPNSVVCANGAPIHRRGMGYGLKGPPFARLFPDRQVT